MDQLLLVFLVARRPRNKHCSVSIHTKKNWCEKIHQLMLTIQCKELLQKNATEHPKPSRCFEDKFNMDMYLQRREVIKKSGQKN